MKNHINIITRHAINNYGSFLQTYASIKILENMGFDCRIIDYISNDENLFGNLKNFAKMRGLKGLKRIIYIMLKFPEEFYKNIKFSKQRNKYFKMTKRFSEKTIKQFDDSILCSGSDQLWGYMPNGTIDWTYYLNFANHNNTLFSLSSSFGRYDFCEKEMDIMSKLLNKYQFITVREKSAVEFVSKFGVSARHVLDPTLLVNRTEYYNLASPKINKGKYVLVYKLRHDEQLDKLALVLSKKYNLEIKYITNSIFFRNKNGKNYPNKSINKVLAMFRDSQYVVTDSFHATVLSTIFEKEFYTHLPGKTNSRIIDFLDMLDLSDRYFDDFERIKFDDIKIDYTLIDNIVSRKKIEDLDYIKHSLQGVLRNSKD